MTAVKADRAQQRALKETPKLNVFSSTVSKVHILETDLHLCLCGICSVHPAENLLLHRCLLAIIEYVVQLTLVQMCLFCANAEHKCSNVQTGAIGLPPTGT